MTGLISLGHGFFFAVGAYATAILSGTHGWPLLASFAVAAASGGYSGSASASPRCASPRSRSRRSPWHSR